VSTITANDGHAALPSGTANTLVTAPVTLPQGVYLVYFYNCLAAASQDYYLSVTAQASAGTITSGNINRQFSQAFLYQFPPFVMKVSSTTATVTFQAYNPQGGSTTITNGAGSCSGFDYWQIGP
jgi:hypothetical protein